MPSPKKGWRKTIKVDLKMVPSIWEWEFSYPLELKVSVTWSTGTTNKETTVKL